MNTLLVVNGEAYWQEHFPGIEVHTCRLQASRWLYEEGKLWVFQSSGALRVEAVLLRGYSSGWQPINLSKPGKKR